MKTKLYILLFLVPLSNLIFGQRGDTYNFSFKVKFDKDIPVDSLQLFYIEQESRLNRINTIHFETNQENEIILKGENYSIAGNENYFPTIIFSLKGNDFIDDLKKETETNKVFYLISKMESFIEDFDNEIFFTSLPNSQFIKVDFEWQNDKRVYTGEQMSIEQIAMEAKILESITTKENLIKINKK